MSRRTLPSVEEEAIGINTKSGKEEAGATLLCLPSQRLLQTFSEAWHKLSNSACNWHAPPTAVALRAVKFLVCLCVCLSVCAAPSVSARRLPLPLPLPLLLLLLLFLSLLPFRGLVATFQFQFADGNAKR